jgi:hypothetical protein
MRFETQVDVILLRHVVVKDDDDNPILERGRPKTEIKVMMYDSGDGYMLPGGAVPEIPPEDCEGCDPFDDNAPCEVVAMNLVEHLSGLSPHFIEDAAYHQFTWKNCTDYTVKPIVGKAVLYYYGFVQEETEEEREKVEEILAENASSIKFFSEAELNSPHFAWAGGEKDEETIKEILRLFKPHVEH